uniref:Uncharacterized protein n=1 Tax=Rhizophora mucronata TaxID=61149 RepID=A0A2P2NB56_RHIMU
MTITHSADGINLTIINVVPLFRSYA